MGCPSSQGHSAQAKRASGTGDGTNAGNAADEAATYGDHSHDEPYDGGYIHDEPYDGGYINDEPYNWDYFQADPYFGDDFQAKLFWRDNASGGTGPTDYGTWCRANGDGRHLELYAQDDRGTSVRAVKWVRSTATAG